MFPIFRNIFNISEYSQLLGMFPIFQNVSNFSEFFQFFRIFPILWIIPNFSECSQFCEIFPIFRIFPNFFEYSQFLGIHQTCSYNEPIKLWIHEKAFYQATCSRYSEFFLNTSNKIQTAFPIQSKWSQIQISYVKSRQ